MPAHSFAHRLILACGVILLASLAACASSSSTTTSTPGPIAWGDGAKNLQIGLAILQSSHPKPLPNQYVIYLRNTGIDPIHIVCPPQELTDDQVVQSDQAEPPTSMMTLCIAKESGYLNFNVQRPDPPKLVELKSGQMIQITLNLSADPQLHPGNNTRAFFARYYNFDPMAGIWTGSIQSPSFTVRFIQK
jgi:hypothetical protein